MPRTRSAPRLHYDHQRAGADDAPTLIFIHELGGSSWSWTRVVERLADDHSTLSFDQRGAGLSDGAAGPFEPQALVDDLQSVIEAAGLAPPYCLVSSAGGAGVAAAFALAKPACVAGVAFCSPLLLTEAARAQLVARADRVEHDGMQAIAGGLDSIYPAPLRGADFPEYRRRWLAHDPLSFALLSRALAQTSPEMSALECPCLLLAGWLDVRPVAQIEAAARTFHRARVVVAEQGGHILPVQAPAFVARELRAFIASLED